MKTSAFVAIGLVLLSLFAGGCLGLSGLSDLTIPTAEFEDSAHHWYDIKDTDKVIEPLADQKRYSPEEYEEIADNILLYQKSHGGWPKNYDMRAVLTPEQSYVVTKSKDAFNTCFDNGATHSQVNYLGQVLARNNQPKYRRAFTSGLRYILSAQYANGGWPQYFPDTSGYRKYITYNDGAMVGIMKLLQKIVNKDAGYQLHDEPALYDSVLRSFNMGIECLLNTQIKESDSLLVWCQQHDNVTLLPAAARTFEPAAICNGESAEIVEFLMSIRNPTERIKNSIHAAIKWYEKSRIYGITVKTIPAPQVEFIYRSSNTDRVVVEDPDAPPIWTRYYQLQTHQPIFCNRDGVIVYSLAEVERERRVGYAWYVYDPQKILDYYPKWLKRINEK